MAEYLVIIGLIALGVVAAFKTFGSSIFSASGAQAETVTCVALGESTTCGGPAGAGGSSPPPPAGGGIPSSPSGIPGPSGGPTGGGPTGGAGGGGPIASNGSNGPGGGCLGGLCTSPGRCFVAGTPVLTPTGFVPIEAIQEGDLVVSRDERSGAVVAEPVLRTFLRGAQSLVDLRIGDPDGDAETIRVTPGHLIWTLDEGWKEAGELARGEALNDVHGRELHVLSTSPVEEEAPVYNFEVRETHTYFVGGLALWVHNNPTVIGYDPYGNPVLEGEYKGGTRPSDHKPVFYDGSDPTYRADSRPPKTIFNQGFQPRYPKGKANLENHVINHNPGPWISTSTEQDGAALFGKPGDHVYTIAPGPKRGTDVNKTMGNDHKYAHQNEVTYYGSIPTTQIVGAQEVGKGGKLGPLKPNPNYPGNQGGGTSCVIM